MPSDGQAPVTDAEIAIQEELNIALLVIALVSVLLRAFVKLRILRSVRMDDYLMLLAFTLFAGLAICDVVIGGYGRRLIRGDMSVIGIVSALAMTVNSLYALCNIFVKCSLGLFMMWIMGPASRFRRALIIGLTACSTSLSIILFALGLTCGGASIQSNVDNCSLIPVTVRFNVAWSIVNMLTDVIFAALCIYTVHHANMARRSKIVAGVLLCFGSLGACASIMRVVACLNPAIPSLDRRRILIARYSAIEAGITISAASLATLRPLIRIWASKVKSTLSRSKADPTGTSGGTDGRVAKSPQPGFHGGVNKSVVIEQTSYISRHDSWDGCDDMNDDEEACRSDKHKTAMELRHMRNSPSITAEGRHRDLLPHLSVRVTGPNDPTASTENLVPSIPATKSGSRKKRSTPPPTSRGGFLDTRVSAEEVITADPSPSQSTTSVMGPRDIGLAR